MMSDPKKELRKQMDRTRKAHELRDSSGLSEEVEALEAWQKGRLLSTYDDLIQQHRYRQATDFFVEELYAPPDLPRRNEDLERMYPLLIRMLPDSVISIVASAVHLQALTLWLDLQTTRVLVDNGVDLFAMTVHDYSMAYRKLDNRDARQAQIDLIVEVGHGLEKYVHNPMIYSTLKMARPLAAITGLKELQTFLEHGFDAFRALNGAETFLETIDKRENVILDALMSGDVDAIEPWFTPIRIPGSLERAE